MITTLDGTDIIFSLQEGERFLPHVFDGELFHAPVTAETQRLILILPAEVYAAHRLDLQDAGFMRGGTMSSGIRVIKVLRSDETQEQTFAERATTMQVQEIQALELMQQRYGKSEA